MTRSSQSVHAPPLPYGTSPDLRRRHGLLWFGLDHANDALGARWISLILGTASSRSAMLQARSARADSNYDPLLASSRWAHAFQEAKSRVIILLDEIHASLTSIRASRRWDKRAQDRPRASISLLINVHDGSCCSSRPLRLLQPLGSLCTLLSTLLARLETRPWSSTRARILSRTDPSPPQFSRSSHAFNPGTTKDLGGLTVPWGRPLELALFRPGRSRSDPDAHPHSHCSFSLPLPGWTSSSTRTSTPRPSRPSARRSTPGSTPPSSAPGPADASSSKATSLDATRPSFRPSRA